ncbi:MAG: TOBE domain-containing protein, partial [Pontimonas sp.]
HKPAKDHSSVEGQVVEVAYTGANTITIIENPAGIRIISTQLNEELPGHKDSFAVGDKVVATWRNDHVATIPQ